MRAEGDRITGELHDETSAVRLAAYRAWLKHLGQPDLVITKDGEMFYTAEGTGRIIDRRV
jgi:hypothetical protein